jgi:hypothetical protein
MTEFKAGDIIMPREDVAGETPYTLVAYAGPSRVICVGPTKTSICVSEQRTVELKPSLPTADMHMYCRHASADECVAYYRRLAVLGLLAAPYVQEAASTASLY